MGIGLDRASNTLSSSFISGLAASTLPEARRQRQLDSRMVKAAAAAALGIVLLLPTFNALNNSYVQNVPPPPWVPTPSTIPDFKPPPDFDASKYKGQIPPGGCPPPIIQVIKEATFNDSITQSSNGLLPIGNPTSYDLARDFSPPNGTYAIIGFVNLTQWEGTNFTATVHQPGGGSWSGYGNNTMSPPRQEDESILYNSYEALGHKPAPSGQYTLTLHADAPFVQGDIRSTFYSIIPCGGLL